MNRSLNFRQMLLASGVAMVLSSASAMGAMIVAGNVTTELGPDFFFDVASGGGGDFNQTNAAFRRDFGPLNVGPAGSIVSITGLGWALSGAGTAATSATATITYLGLDGAGGGGDDVLFGSTSGSLSFTAAGEYVFEFDVPLVQTIDGLNSFFRISLSGTNGASPANLRYKTTSTTALTANDVKLSVAGTSVAAQLQVPEPSTVLMLGMIICGGAAVVMRGRLG